MRIGSAILFFILLPPVFFKKCIFRPEIVVVVFFCLRVNNDFPFVRHRNDELIHVMMVTKVGGREKIFFHRFSCHEEGGRKGGKKRKISRGK